MNYDEWLNVDYFYYKEDEDGNLVKDSLLDSCEMVDDTNAKCTFTVGTVNGSDYGVTDNWQPAAGWKSASGDYGVVSWGYSYTFV